MNSTEMISIPEYFAGQSILITGGTGFMGKVLVEKILRSCPDVEKLYLMIRPKKGVSIEERWSKITGIPLFEKLKTKNPEPFKKVHLIPGNMTSDHLGFSREDMQLLLEKVTLVYHTAAMIQFNDSMKAAFIENVRGTYSLLEFAKNIRHLKVFVYMSTAYSNVEKGAEKSVEKILPACQDWKVMMKMMESNPLEFEYLKEKLLDGHPNPYTWSKSLAEQVVNEYTCYFPTIIMRPGIVVSTLEDPITGWADTINGYSGLALGIIYGYVRISPVKADHNLDFVPVDSAIKASLIAPWKQELTRQHITNDLERFPDVYNCTYMNNLPIKNIELHIYGKESLERYPSCNSIWVPSLTFSDNEAVIRIWCWLQILPAAASDLILLAKGKRAILLRIAKKLVNGLRLTRILRKEKMTFPNEQFLCLKMCLKEEDKEAFSYKTKFSSEEKKKMITDQILGLRKYFLKEDLSEEAIKRNRERMKKIRLMHRIYTSAVYLGATWFVVSYTKGPITQLIWQ